ncbi:MAG TPA: hypothetical protein DEF35_22305 [Paenibacillus sp.]|nr:hypothetical protein P364_0100070 [Paenibacillus sp. MAEPY2]KGP87322.1 hypothetical protein P363_0113630 [Paenibacillus sp. MAEPY1]OZQ69942.1 hypothetical protein CA599_13025 [Paenibacillus taichungensis]HBU84353.1 hypothetical protein [Paenibacillus sp.]
MISREARKQPDTLSIHRIVNTGTLSDFVKLKTSRLDLKYVFTFNQIVGYLETSVDMGLLNMRYVKIKYNL